VGAVKDLLATEMKVCTKVVARFLEASIGVISGSFVVVSCLFIMLFTSALAVASLGTAAALGASDLTAETFIEQTSEDISALLAEWGMDRVFADEFSAVQVDGEALAHTPQDELEAAFAHANIATMHWNRLHRRLAPFRNAVVMPEAGDSAGPGAAGGARRSLQSTVEPDGYSGIRMNHNKSMVTFGNDMAILRTETGIDAVTPLLTIHGDLNISGTAYGDFPGSSAGDYGTSRGNPAKSCRAILQRNDAARDGIYYITRLGAKAPFRAYCDMSRGGLELVFKISHGVGGDAQTLWDDKSALNEETKYMNVLSNGHYSSSQKASAWKHNNLLAVNTHIMQARHMLACLQCCRQSAPAPSSSLCCPLDANIDGLTWYYWYNVGQHGGSVHDV